MNGQPVLVNATGCLTRRESRILCANVAHWHLSGFDQLIKIAAAPAFAHMHPPQHAGTHEHRQAVPNCRLVCPAHVIGYLAIRWKWSTRRHLRHDKRQYFRPSWRHAARSRLGIGDPPLRGVAHDLPRPMEFRRAVKPFLTTRCFFLPPFAQLLACAAFWGLGAAGMTLPSLISVPCGRVIFLPLILFAGDILPTALAGGFSCCDIGRLHKLLPLADPS